MSATYEEASELVLAAFQATRRSAQASERFCLSVPGHEDYALVQAAHAEADEAQAEVWRALIRLTEQVPA